VVEVSLLAKCETKVLSMTGSGDFGAIVVAVAVVVDDDEEAIDDDVGVVNG
jgi:hypothetical protein